MKKYLVKPGKKFHLGAWDPDEASGLPGGKDEAEKALAKLRDELRKLQHLLYAEHKHKILIVLQGMDTSGKDSTIRFVFEGVNPQGVHVAQFGVPTRVESDHDYLWRVHHHTPSKGEIVIFNRSQYEDVLTVRVHNTVPRNVWQKRYKHINEFERLLSDEGTVILKFFLHISKDEQKERLEDRLKDPAKRWKFQENDIKERLLWDRYMKAYSDAMTETSTPWAPWYIIPANKKWHRNRIIASVIVGALRKLRMKYPIPEWNIQKPIRIP
jgi:PPK2 family polyphosphate:nucleotide phosphotransferase